jgi:Protein of unknown function (DUF3551)
MRLTRLAIVLMAAQALPALLGASPARAYEKPYDPYPWCAVYNFGRAGNASNCGFLTLEQCRATVSGVGGSCEPNQFYNPRRAAPRHYRHRYYRH